MNWQYGPIRGLAARNWARLSGETFGERARADVAASTPGLVQQPRADPAAGPILLSDVREVMAGLAPAGTGAAQVMAAPATVATPDPAPAVPQVTPAPDDPLPAYQVMVGRHLAHTDPLTLEAAWREAGAFGRHARVVMITEVPR